MFSEGQSRLKRQTWICGRRLYAFVRTLLRSYVKIWGVLRWRHYVWRDVCRCTSDGMIFKVTSQSGKRFRLCIDCKNDVKNTEDARLLNVATVDLSTF